MMQKVKKILFVCTGNTCRSPMAESICRKIAEEKSLPVVCGSAGINAITGLPASENTVDVCKEIGIDLSDFTSTWICDTNPAEYDLFAVMSNSHKATLIALGIAVEKIIILNEDNNGITDPYGGNLEIYRKCRDEIEKAVNTILEGIKNDD